MILSCFPMPRYEFPMPGTQSSQSEESKLPEFPEWPTAATRQKPADQTADVTRVQRVPEQSAAQPAPRTFPGEVFPSKQPDRTAAANATRSEVISPPQGTPAQNRLSSRSDGERRSAHFFQRLDWQSTLSVLYLVGAALCCGWLVLGRVLLVRMLWSASPPEPWLGDLYDSLDFPSRRRRPRLVICLRCGRALCFGLLRPTIVLPGEWCRADNTAQLRSVLLHELAHVHQRDAWGRFLFNLGFPLLYFHPLYWWIRSQVTLCQELIADDWAAGQTDKESYVKELIIVAKEHGRRRGRLLGVTGMFESPTQFYRRMQMLIQREQSLATRCSKLWRMVSLTAGVTAVCVATSFLGVQSARAQPASGANAAAVLKLLKQRDALQSDLSKAQEQLATLQQQLAELQKRLSEHRAQASWGKVYVGSRAVRVPDAPSATCGPARRKKYGAQIARRGRTGQTPATTPKPGKSKDVAVIRYGAAVRKGALGNRRESPILNQPLVAGSQPDLVALANAYVDAISAKNLARVKLERFAKLEEKRAISKKEVELAEFEYEAADMKYGILRQIAEVWVQASKTELESLQQAYKAGEIIQSRVIQAIAKYNILKAISKLR